eukprot:scaffold2848_cov218-Pinguiococcus_pyrenoidosus.AAC.4
MDVADRSQRHSDADWDERDHELKRQGHAEGEELYQHHDGRRHDLHELIGAHGVGLQGQIVEHDKAAEGHGHGKHVHLAQPLDLEEPERQQYSHAHRGHREVEDGHESREVEVELLENELVCQDDAHRRREIEGHGSNIARQVGLRLCGDFRGHFSAPTSKHRPSRLCAAFCARGSRYPKAARSGSLSRLPLLYPLDGTGVRSKAALTRSARAPRAKQGFCAFPTVS